ncbi:MAG: nitrate reductase [Actinomycetia bacterium]|nr:nitrate reductase [Actinomycetes bacterium]
MAIWHLHGDGVNVAAGEVVRPDERLTWPRTVGMGMQHVVAMFGATFLVPLITGFPPATTLFFSAIGTFTFLLITGNRLPSYLGSSFAFLAPIAAAKASGMAGGGVNWGAALFGVFCAGALLALVGVVVHFAGAAWIDKAMPPVVTGTIVMLIGFNLAPSAWNNYSAAPVTSTITVVAILLVTVLFKGIIGRLSILIGVIIGYVAALVQDAAGVRVAGHDCAGVAAQVKQIQFCGVKEAAWVGLPPFQHPTISWAMLLLFAPVVLALIAENIGHVKSVALMTGQNYDRVTGRALLSDGIATMFAGLGGGSGTTTYAENIGVMAATRIYSTAVYWVAGATALALSLIPKFGILIATIPPGVLGGAGTVLYGMIGLLGARIWIENRVDFGNSVNLFTAAVALIAGIANFSFFPFDAANPAAGYRIGGITVGAFAAIIIYHVMRWIARRRGTFGDDLTASPASVGREGLEQANPDE